MNMNRIGKSEINTHEGVEVVEIFEFIGEYIVRAHVNKELIYNENFGDHIGLALESFKNHIGMNGIAINRRSL